MKLDYKKYKISESEFDSLSVIEKRAYILQDHQEETMWWSRTANKIVVMSLIIGIFALLLIMLNLHK